MLFFGGETNSLAKESSIKVLEDRVEDAGEGNGEHLDKDLDEDFWHSSRRCRWSRFFDENIIPQCLQDGLLHYFSCVCQIKRAIEEHDALQSLQ